jgi:hypothetical protein
MSICIQRFKMLEDVSVAEQLDTNIDVCFAVSVECGWSAEVDASEIDMEHMQDKLIRYAVMVFYATFKSVRHLSRSVNKKLIIYI